MEAHEPFRSTPAPPPRGSMVNGWLVLILIGLVVVFVYRDFRRQAAILNPDALDRLVAPRGDLAADEQSTIELFKKVSPAVVHVTNLDRRVDDVSLNLIDLPQGVGSGFVWDRSGYIVTNFHVLQGASAASVTLADNTTWEAHLVGFDDSKDLAVLKIEAPPERLQPVLLGSSADLQVGQKVFAIGSPFELDQTLTTGVIGGLGREIKSVSGRPIQGVIQTDAAINPGNSGGPLLDSAGRLIGVNTAIASLSGGSMGIGFAVPVDTVGRVVPELIRKGKVDRPGLGISTYSDQFTRRLGLEGVLIQGVLPDGAAVKAGLRPTVRKRGSNTEWGDLIVALDGHAVRNMKELFSILDERSVGDEIKVTYQRNGQQLETTVTLQSLPTMSP